MTTKPTDEQVDLAMHVAGQCYGNTLSGIASTLATFIAARDAKNAELRAEIEAQKREMERLKNHSINQCKAQEQAESEIQSLAEDIKEAYRDRQEQKNEADRLRVHLEDKSKQAWAIQEARNKAEASLAEKEKERGNLERLLAHHLDEYTASLAAQAQACANGDCTPAYAELVAEKDSCIAAQAQEIKTLRADRDELIMQQGEHGDEIAALRAGSDKVYKIGAEMLQGPMDRDAIDSVGHKLMDIAGLPSYLPALAKLKTLAKTEEKYAPCYGCEQGRCQIDNCGCKCHVGGDQP